MLGNGISLIWCHLYSYLLSNWWFAEKFSNCSNSLNFKAKINCHTIKTNVPKWRKTCTGSKFDWLHFYGPQSHILLLDHFEGPIQRSFINSEPPWMGSVRSCWQRSRLRRERSWGMNRHDQRCLTIFDTEYNTRRRCLLPTSTFSLLKCPLNQWQCPLLL